MVKIKIYTLGCKVNQYDSRNLSELLGKSGVEIVDRNAQLAIINTCAVTKTAVSKSKRTINKAKKENPKAKIILTGCLPEIYKEDFSKLGVDFVSKISSIVKIVKSNFLEEQHDFLCDKKVKGRIRYNIKIQDGCEQFCSYCIIPFARGKLKSRSEVEVIKEAKRVVSEGYKEVVLCGIHLGLFGYRENYNLLSLLKKIVKINNLERIRLSSIEVREVSSALIDFVSKNEKVCNHFHIPLQSGSDKILKLMNRPYKLKYFEDKVKSIRKKIPNCAITTDVIVGFPGETKKDFQEICKFVKKMKFSRLHVFPFSAHEKALASKFKGQIKREEKLKRARILRKIGESLEKEYKGSFKGKKLGVIVENSKEGKAKGKTEYYFELESKEKARVGNTVEIIA